MAITPKRAIGMKSQYTDKMNMKDEFGTSTFFSGVAGTGSAQSLTLSYPSTTVLTNAMCIFFNTLDNAEDTKLNSNFKDVTDVYNLLSGISLLADDADGNAGILKHTTAQGIMQGNLTDAIATGATAINSAFSSLYLKKYKRTSSCIWIMMPNKVEYMTNAGWEQVNEDLGALGLIAKNLAAGKDSKTMRDVAAMTGAEVTRNTLDFVQEGLGTSMMKSVQNSFTDQAFKGMQRRSFQFSWQFAPRTEDELNRIDSIISFLRFHAHPSFSSIESTGSYLTFPGQIDIEWYTKDTGKEYVENQWLPRISTCIIQGIDTDYSPSNHFTFFNNSGAPTQIHLTIKVEEIQPLSKIDIARGF